MKRILFSLLAVAAATSLSAAGQPTKGITGTMHDLSATGYKNVTNVNQVCVFCHTPHNAAVNQIVPLWNHTTSSATYGMYGGGTAAASTLKGQSLACLSCHDGTVAVGSLVNTPYGFGPTQATPLNYNVGINGNQVTAGLATAAGAGLMVGSHATGTDLSNDHPINIAYPTADAGFVTTPADVKLYGGQVECASCHDVHNWGGTGVTGAPFLRVDNTGSALCLRCHIK